ncbi:hypothetical protein GE061_016571 [Apolygus lucorum]|uniref:Uncharacterized protein n=1 Tax=Apolygus lucorum TaxID=248454 RepID=A0A6A4K2Z0_APOLU|nr:hypothetical protein GE061_016571 [Apolygus lucorum]
MSLPGGIELEEGEIEECNRRGRRSSTSEDRDNTYMPHSGQEEPHDLENGDIQRDSRRYHSSDEHHAISMMEDQGGQPGPSSAFHIPGLAELVEAVATYWIF